MTKPANFPGRKNQRRIKASHRMARSLDRPDKWNRHVVEQQLADTRAKIIDQEVAEGIQTKKYRGRS